MRPRGFWELGVLGSRPNSAWPCVQTDHSLGLIFPICVQDHLKGLLQLKWPGHSQMVPRPRKGQRWAGPQKGSSGLTATGPGQAELGPGYSRSRRKQWQITPRRTSPHGALTGQSHWVSSVNF